MKNKLIGAWMLALALCIMGPVQAASTNADEEAVAQALRLMYVALTHHDMAQLRAVTTTDFYTFDGGEEFSRDAFMALIQRLNAEGKTYVWNVTEPRVRVEGKLAWITYVNRGSVQDAAGKRDVSWLESAVLLKDTGTWRIQFFHSTRVPVKSAPPASS
jgi:hypothetical protein